MPQVEFIMPRDASGLMQRQIARGSDGIDEIIKSLSQVNSEEAKAWKMEDEIKVKLIRPMRWFDVYCFFLTPRQHIYICGDSWNSMCWDMNRFQGNPWSRRFGEAVQLVDVSGAVFDASDFLFFYIRNPLFFDALDVLHVNNLYIYLYIDSLIFGCIFTGRGSTKPVRIELLFEQVTLLCSLESWFSLKSCAS